ALSEDWHGRHHRRFLRRAHVCRLRSPLESAAARWRHYRVSCAVLLFHHRFASQRPSVCGKCAVRRACDFFSGHRFQGRRMWPAALARRPAECIAGWVGVGMMPRGEVALIVALVGLRSQIVLPSTYAIVVFMTAVTTILAPPLLRYLYRGEIKAM